MTRRRGPREERCEDGRRLEDWRKIRGGDRVKRPKGTRYGEKEGCRFRRGHGRWNGADEGGYERLEAEQASRRGGMDRTTGDTGGSEARWKERVERRKVGRE